MFIRNIGIIIILFISHVICIGQQQTHIQYTVRDGLPSDYVYRVFQDSKGFIWFGTDAGVSRFNGSIFENFSMQDGLADNDIFDIKEDQQGRIWFATYNGRLCYFKDQKFHNSDNDPILKNQDFNSYISCIYLDTQKNVWFGSTRDGILYLDTNNTFHKIPESNFYKGNLRTYPSTHGIWQNDSEDVIVLTNLSIVNLTKRKNVSLDELGIQIGSGNFNQVKAMTLSEDTLLITENGNFHLVDYKAQTPLIKVNFDSLNSPVVFLKKNTTGDIWAGTYEGIFQIKDSFDGTINEVNLLNGLTVSSRTKDVQGNVWYTTLQKGVYFIPQNNVENFTIHSGLPEKAVNTISGNNLGTILIGQGDYFSFINKGKITSMTENPYYKIREVKKSYAQKINYVSLDDQGQYLIASNYGLVAQQQGNILYYPGSTDCAINYKNDSILIADIDLIITNKNELLTLDNSSALANHSNFKTRLLKNSYVNSLYWSKHTNTLWVGLANGLMVYKNHNLRNISTIHPALKGRISDIIESAIDKSIWIAIDGYGVLQLNENGQPMLHISTKEGLSSNRSNGLSEDKNGDLWVATSLGLNKINFQDNKYYISQYGRRDGLLSDKINDIYIGENKAWVATDEGLSAMNLYNEDNYVMPLYISAIKIDGNTRLISEDWNTLSYDQNNISINFVALDYQMVGKVSYRYKIKGNHDWSYTTNNTVEFSSLTHGNYSFMVQAKNKQGTWNDQGATFNFTINPPFWATWWAYLGYFLLSIGVIYAIFIYEFRRKLLKSELLLEKKESTKIKELEQLKSHFFSNISHEFRTPLTLILGPLEQIIDKINDGNIKRQLQIVNRNASGLLHLINQLLDISKLESGKLTLHLEYKDIMLDIDTIAEQFEILVKQKGIHFEVKKSIDVLIMQYDPKKMEMILNNLLSNAIKFTPKGGAVKLEAFINKDEVNNELNKLTVSISDTGIGISKKSLPHIFERFYQEDSSVGKEYEGTGVGLSLTKEMIELHQGSVSVNSIKEKGSTFTIEIPVITSIETIELPTPQINDVEVLNSSEPTVAIKEAYMESTHNTPTILVVEDNAEMQLYLEDILSENYQVILTGNGEDGIKMAKKIVPDLIVSDVMMPKVSGIELCSQLKQHELTSHIPIILLTAKAATENKVEGYETGAEAYLTKPFSHLELKAQVKTLINQRINLHNRFKKEFGLLPEELDVSSIDQQFLQRTLKIIEKNMDDSSFTVLTFANEFGSSREHISRKIKGLTGQTTSEFIRTQRLKRAAQLLTQKSGNVAEIGYSVGFTNPAYFSRCFTKLFGISPSQYPRQ